MRQKANLGHIICMVVWVISLLFVRFVPHHHHRGEACVVMHGHAACDSHSLLDMLTAPVDECPMDKDSHPDECTHSDAACLLFVPAYVHAQPSVTVASVDISFFIVLLTTCLVSLASTRVVPVWDQQKYLLADGNVRISSLRGPPAIG